MYRPYLLDLPLLYERFRYTVILFQEKRKNYRSIMSFLKPTGSTYHPSLITKDGKPGLFLKSHHPFTSFRH